MTHEGAAPESGVTRGFLFADLRSYTAFVERHGNEAGAELLGDYRSLVREQVARHSGAEIRTEGDSFYVVFSSASNAVRCGLSIVEAAAEASGKRPDRPIQVGIGIHAGETVDSPDGYVGSAVNIAARVCSQAEAGEVLVSETMRELVRSSLPVAFVHRGRRHLKGIAAPVALYRVLEGPSRGKEGRFGVWSSRLASLESGQRRTIGAAAVALSLVLAGLLLAGQLVGLSRREGMSPNATRTGASSLVLAEDSAEATAPAEASNPAPSPFVPPLRVAVKFPIGELPWGVVADAHAVWVLHANGGFGSTSERDVIHIDPRNNRQVARIVLPDPPGDLTSDGTAVWVAAGLFLHRIDARTNEVTKSIEICPLGLESGFRSIWVIGPARCIAIAEGAPGHEGREVPGNLLRLDPATSQTVATIGLPDGAGSDIAVSEDSVWVSGEALFRIDPKTNRVRARINVNSKDIAYGARSVWVLPSRDEVLRVDPESGRVSARIGGLTDASHIAFGAGYVWVSGTAAGLPNFLWQIDPATNRIVSATPLGTPDYPGGGGGVAAAFGSAWVCATAPNELWRIPVGP
jgi:class 3 adenylate cyclase